MLIVSKENLEWATQHGFSCAQLADLLGVSHSYVIRAEKQYNIKLHRGNRARTYRYFIQDMKAPEAIEFLLECLDLATFRDRIPEYSIIGPYDGPINRCYRRLVQSAGRSLSKNELYNAMYFDRSESELPTMKIVDVMIHKIRKKLPPHQQIQTIWGWGYRMIDTTLVTEGPDNEQSGRNQEQDQPVNIGNEC